MAFYGLDVDLVWSELVEESDIALEWLGIFEPVGVGLVDVGEVVVLMDVLAILVGVDVVVLTLGQGPEGETDQDPHDEHWVVIFV